VSLARLSALDAAFLALESPQVPMHVGWAAVFSAPAEGSRPSFEAIRAHVNARLHRAPRYRQKVVTVPMGLSDPVWVDDRRFDIEHHVRRAEGRDFGELVDEVMSGPLDHDRPLWQLWIAEQLEDGRLGVVGKAHHCLVDGLAAVELMALLLDVTPDPAQVQPEAWAPATGPSSQELLVDALKDGVGRALKLARRPLEYAREPGQVLDLPARAWGSGRALVHTVWPPAPLSRLNGPMSSRRHLACRSRSLEDLKIIKRRFGTTVNDVLLAACAGAVRALHEGSAGPAAVKAMVPVSVSDPDDEWGNRIAFLFLELPCDEADPLWRLRDVHVAMRERKQDREPEGADALLQALSYAPRPVRPLLSRVLASPRVSNLTISNIPAPQQPLYLLGCEAERAYPVVPLTDGHGVSIGMTSVAGQACFGVYAQAGLATAADSLASGIDEAIDELLACCDLNPPATQERHRGRQSVHRKPSLTGRASSPHDRTATCSMSADETREGDGGGVMAGLLAPLRLPKRLLESLADAAGDVGSIRSELTRVREQTEPLDDLMPAVERLVKQTEPVAGLVPAVEEIRKQAEPLAELLPALERIEERLGSRLDSVHQVVKALESDDSYLNKAVKELRGELEAMHKTVAALQDDVQRATDRLPDPGEKRGPLQTARDVLTGSGD
jgi:diacylglycerol O-acyltransferase / wax synthase